MTDLVSKADLIAHLDECIKESDGHTPIVDSVLLAIKHAVEQMPTIDDISIKHGHWIYNKDTGEIRCNLCNALVGVTMYSDDVEPIAEVENFCFNCGAKMDEKDNNG